MPVVPLLVAALLLFVVALLLFVAALPALLAVRLLLVVLPAPL